MLDTDAGDDRPDHRSERMRRDHRIPCTGYPQAAQASRFDRFLVAVFVSAGAVALPLGLGWLVARCVS